MIRDRSGDCNTRRQVATKTIDGALYVAKESDAIYLVAPTANSEKIPYGFVGKMKYIPASLWDNEVRERLARPCRAALSYRGAFVWCLLPD